MATIGLQEGSLLTSAHFSAEVRGMAAAGERIDVDAAITWPPEVRRRAETIARMVRGTARCVEDMRVAPEIADEFRGLFVGHRVRAYHATRLLGHEVEMVRLQGLRPLSKKLVIERIERAYESGVLTFEDRDRLLSGNVFAEGRWTGREGHVSLFLSRTPLERMVHGVRPLLTTWGGEGIYMARGGSSMREALLQGIGTATIVVVEVDLGPDPRVHGIYPELWKLFVARLLGREPLSADLLYMSFVPPDGVIDFWQPGHPSYDVHERLPRT